jgi:hypothetical protein
MCHSDVALHDSIRMKFVRVLLHLMEVLFSLLVPTRAEIRGCTPSLEGGKGCIGGCVGYVSGRLVLGTVRQ